VGWCDLAIHAARILLHEVAHQERNVSRRSRRAHRHRNTLSGSRGPRNCRSSTICVRSRLVAATRRASVPMVRELPPLELALLQHAQQLGLESSGSRPPRPGTWCRDSPARSPIRAQSPVNRLARGEHLALQQPVGIAAQFSSRTCLLRALSSWIARASSSFPAGLAINHDGGIVARRSPPALAGLQRGCCHDLLEAVVRADSSSR